MFRNQTINKTIPISGGQKSQNGCQLYCESEVFPDKSLPVQVTKHITSHQYKS